MAGRDGVSSFSSFSSSTVCIVHAEVFCLWMQSALALSLDYTALRIVYFCALSDSEGAALINFWITLEFGTRFFWISLEFGTLSFWVSLETGTLSFWILGEFTIRSFPGAARLQCVGCPCFAGFQ